MNKQTKSNKIIQVSFDDHYQYTFKKDSKGDISKITATQVSDSDTGNKYIDHIRFDVVATHEIVKGIEFVLK